VTLPSETLQTETFSFYLELVFDIGDLIPAAIEVIGALNQIESVTHSRRFSPCLVVSEQLNG
jgi:hypothetical protein